MQLAQGFRPRRLLAWGIVLVALWGFISEGGIGPASAADPVLQQFSVPTAGADPYSIVTGPDGNLWFTEYAAGKVAKLTPGGVITEYPLPSATSGPTSLVVGTDSNLWFTETGANKIGRITTSGVITEFDIPTASTSPFGIANGPGGLWFTEQNKDRLARITTAGVFTEFTTTGMPTGGNLDGIIQGADGNMWIPMFFRGTIGRVSADGSTYTEFAASPNIESNTGPLLITNGPDGNLWYTNNSGASVGRMTTAGVASEFKTPTGGTSNFFDIATGPDGNMWATAQDGGFLSRITMAGDITEFKVPGAQLGASTGPSGVTSGPGGVWFTERYSHQIGMFTVSAPPTTAPPTTAPPTTAPPTTTPPTTTPPTTAPPTTTPPTTAPPTTTPPTTAPSTTTPPTTTPPTTTPGSGSSPRARLCQSLARLRVALPFLSRTIDVLSIALRCGVSRT